MIFHDHCVCSVAQSCPTLCDPVDCSLPGILCPWEYPGKNTRVGCHYLLQGIFLTQGWSPHLLCLLHRQVDSLPLHHLGKPPCDYYNAPLGKSKYKAHNIVPLKKICLFIWLHQVLVVAHRILSCSMWVGSSSLTRY